MTTLVITGYLETATALHIGAGQSSSTADSLVRRTAAGEVFIPGSALGGSLRALATALAPRLTGQVCKALWSQADVKQFTDQQRQAEAAGRTRPLTACDCPVCHLFGAVDPQADNTEALGGRAARLWVYDARLVDMPNTTPAESTTAASLHPLPGPAADPVTTIRDGVGIDRRTGAAARLEAVKFDLEALPAHATFTLRLEVEEPNEADERLLAAVLAEWQAGRGAVGGRVARGLGAVVLKPPSVARRDLNDPLALLSFLRGEDAPAGLATQPQWLESQVTTVREGINPVDRLWRRDAVSGRPVRYPPSQAVSVARSWIEIEMTLQATGPFLANDVTRSGRAGFDHAPLVEGKPILPGASLRGILRSHAERIARTLATSQATSADEFWERCPACNPLLRPLDRDAKEQEETARQGATPTPRPLPTLQVCDSRPGLKASVEDEVAEEKLCLACRLFGSTELGSRLLIEDAPLMGETVTYKVQDFLAIDRFTGGGRDTAKFDAAVLWRPRFRARLRLMNPRDWELGWLALVLRDLAEGWLTLGFGRAKGFGQVVVTSWTARIGYLTPTDFPAPTYRDSDPGDAEATERAEDAEAPADEDTLASQATAPVTPPPPTLWEQAPTVDQVSVYHIVALGGQAADEQDQVAWRAPGVDAGGWRDQVAGWVKAFEDIVSDTDRSRTDKEMGRPAVDTYFGQPAETLYPKAKEDLPHAQ